MGRHHLPQGEEAGTTKTASATSIGLALNGPDFLDHSYSSPSQAFKGIFVALQLKCIKCAQGEGGPFLSLNLHPFAFFWVGILGVETEEKLGADE